MRRYISRMPVHEEPPIIPPLAESGKEDYQRLWKPGFLIAILAIALIAIAFTAFFMTLYGYLDKLIWLENDFVLSNRWTIPAGVLIFSFLVGLCQKYLHAPNVIHGSVMESMRKGQAGSDYRTFPGAFLSSICSLLSGASIGPEGTIATMVSQIAIWIRTKAKIVRDSHDAPLGFDMAALASAFNGIIGSPAFTGVLATEFQMGEKNVFKFLIWNLVAGLVGYFFYLSLGFTSFAALLPFPPLENLSAMMVVSAIVLGIIGSFLAIFTGLCLKGAGELMEKRFGKRIVLRTVAAGIVIAVVCYFLPELLFSGEAQIHAIVQNPAAFGIGMLLMLAILKLVLFSLSFKGGFLGGPVFPILFASTLIGLALSLAFPGIPVGIFVLCIEAATIAFALGAPLTAILLVVVVSNPSPYLAALIVTSVATALVLGALLKPIMEQRTREKAAPAAGQTPNAGI
ncbi:MAG: chloride channel protein [Euryarchaeota archaeon ADurb.BinA087]|nr:MAG: chloride channel protein [Euryarchaeota archaeon ADurb.BinA087]